MTILMIVFLAILAFLIVTDLVPIYKERHRKVFWIYTVLITISCVINVLFVLGIKVPSPAVPLQKLVKLIYRLPD